ncbi:16066_t:CDS:2, partial [Racocetra persica]
MYDYNYKQKDSVDNPKQESSFKYLKILENLELDNSIKPVNQNLIKRINQYSESTLNRYAKNIAIMIKDDFIQSSIFKHHNQKDFISLKSLEYTVNNQNYYLSFGAVDFTQKENKILNIIKIIDSNYISYDAYRGLAAIDYYLPREHIIAIEWNNLTQKITQDVSIKLVDMDIIDSLEIIEESNADNDNIDFNKVLNSIGTGGQFILSPFFNDLKDFKTNRLEVD